MAITYRPARRSEGVGGSIDCWICRAMSSSRARRCSSASRAARSSMCPRSIPRIRSVTSRSALTSSGFQISGSEVSRSPWPIRSTDRASVSRGREMRRAESHTSPRVSPRTPRPIRSCHWARPRAWATSSSRGEARSKVNGSPTSTAIARLPPTHGRPSIASVVCPRAGPPGAAKRGPSAASPRSSSRVRPGSPFGPGRTSRAESGWAITNPRGSTSASLAEGVTRDWARWRESSWSVMSAPTTVPRLRLAARASCQPRAS